MSVNEIKIAIGQRWKTRDGQEVEIVSYDDETATSYVWELSNGGLVTDEGREWGDENDPGDLITIIQDEHGFTPWDGGECPVSSSVKVEYKMKGYDDSDIAIARSLRWEHEESASDIIAYRVVKQEVKPAKVDAEGEQIKEIVVETKTEAKEEPKYTVEQVFEAIKRVTTSTVYMDEIVLVEKELAKTQDPDYKLYLELKAKFE